MTQYTAPAAPFGAANLASFVAAHNDTDAKAVKRDTSHDVTDPAQLAKFANFAAQVASKDGVNCIVGQAVNDLPASTLAFPSGITGFGTFTNAGNTAFGIYGRVEQTLAGVTTNEFNTFNYGADPPGVYPPNRAFGGAGGVLPINLTVAAGGTGPSAIGIHIVPEGSAPQKVLAGIVIDPDAIRDYPLYIDGNTAAYPSMIDGNGTFRALANVAAAFGVGPTDNAAGSHLLVGSLSGTTPFIGASKTQATFSDLAFVTSNVIRMTLLSSGQLRVAQGGSIQIVRAGVGEQVLAARMPGWAVATGTATRTTFATSTVTLPQLAERVKALIDDLHATAGHGLIGT